MTKQNIMDDLIMRNNGYLLTSDVVALGISKTYLSEYVKKREFERVAHGVYLSPNAWNDELYLINLICRSAAFSHETALYLHGFMEREPSEIVLTAVTGYNASHLRKRGCKIYNVNETLYPLGLTEIETNFGNKVRVFDIERTICDIIRYKEKTDIQVFRTAVREYMNSKQKNLHNLMKYAKEMKIENKVRIYTEVML